MAEDFLVGIMIPLVFTTFYFLGRLGIRFIYGKAKAKEIYMPEDPATQGMKLVV